MTDTRANRHWLIPLAPVLPELSPVDWTWLQEFETDLIGVAATEPPPTTGRHTRAGWLLEIRQQLARRHPQTGTGEPVRDAVRQTLVQFVCGFYDLDLRDAYGPGHGALILDAATSPTRQHWAARLAAGELIAIAATERHGGSRIQEITTSARLVGPRWLISGEKCWVSRLAESSGIVVFFRDPDGYISAAIIEASSPGVERELLQPAGLAGWSWGTLRLHQVGINPDRHLLTARGQGIALFRRHITTFRPLVAATALGTAAGVHTMVAEALAARTRIGVLPRVRDNALITLGRTHAELYPALLAAAATSRLAALGQPHADLWARVGKAHAVDTAHRAVADLALLVGAAGFQAHHPIAKARHDLIGLLYADGIHDSLYRSGGTTLLHRHPTSATMALPRPRSAVRADLDRAA